MKNQEVRSLRMREFVALQVLRTRYEQQVKQGRHARAAVIRGQISRQCGKLDGIDEVLEVLNG